MLHAPLKHDKSSLNPHTRTRTHNTSFLPSPAPPLVKSQETEDLGRVFLVKWKQKQTKNTGLFFRDEWICQSYRRAVLWLQAPLALLWAVDYMHLWPCSEQLITCTSGLALSSCPPFVNASIHLRQRLIFLRAKTLFRCVSFEGEFRGVEPQQDFREWGAQGAVQAAAAQALQHGTSCSQHILQHVDVALCAKFCVNRVAVLERSMHSCWTSAYRRIRILNQPVGELGYSGTSTGMANKGRSLHRPGRSFAQACWKNSRG